MEKKTSSTLAEPVYNCFEYCCNISFCNIWFSDFFRKTVLKLGGIIMEFKEQVLDLLVEVTENNIVKENHDIELFEEGIIDSFQTVGLLLEIQNKLDIEVSIMDFDRDEWATPNKIAAVLEELRRN